MKIGILTFHFARNYGAVLQAYGLQEVIKSMGHQACILDYQNAQIIYRNSPFSFQRFVENPLKYFERLVNVYIGYRLSIKKFRNFREKFLNILDLSLSQESGINTDCDILVIGSDQVWNPFITGGPDPVYWCMKKTAARVIAYAASSGDTAALETSAFNNLSEWLENFSAISVREGRLKQFIKKHYERNVNVVVDPTILAGRSVFEKITSKRVIEERYVLIYSVETSPKLLEIARYVSKKRNAKMVAISPQVLSNKLINRDVCYYNANVNEMLSLVKYAECIVALSFHGTVFSLLYEKDFYSVRGKDIGRVEELLNKIGLQNRIVESIGDINADTINFSDINIKLANIRRQSNDWLKEAISLELM